MSENKIWRCRTRVALGDELYERKLVHSKRAYVKRRTGIQWYRQTHPCVDCGEADPVVLQFDHVPSRGPKKFEMIRGSAQNGIKALWRELQKCDVVCANCHVRRTFLRRMGA